MRAHCSAGRRTSYNKGFNRFHRMPISSLDRYSRQVLFGGIGAEGQQRLANSRVVLVGCGATGSATAGLLARAGVGLG